ncbi:MAG: LPS export ABC transporter permease LptG [Gammaproteobacteria bacterium]|jgi:lipopolysaccharide export system permease protein
MKIIDRYIAGVVISGTLTALLVVVGLGVFFSLIGEVEEVGNGGYTLLKMLATVVLTIPNSMYELFPVAALLGSLIGMGMLASNSELIAMRASGMSIWRIVLSVMQAGVFMLLVAVLLGEFVAPLAEQTAQQLRASATDTRVDFMGDRGLWVRDEKLFINATKVVSENTLAGITVYEFDDEGRLKVATSARLAIYRKGQWILRNVQQSEFGEDSVQVSQVDKLPRDSLLTPELLGIVVLKPEDMSARDISQFMGYLEDNGLDTQQYRYALLGRFVTPLSALVMLFVSVPFVFGGLRSVGAGQRLFIGIMVGFGFYILSQIAGQMGRVYDFNPLLATLTPSIIFLLIGIRAVRRL